jgi:hypothetical protein
MTTHSEANLADFLAARARAASDGRLVADVVVGAVALLGLVMWRPVGWVSLVGVALCLTAFGAWGIIDREVRERSDAPETRVSRSLAVLRVVVTGIGAVAAMTTVFAALGVVLGTWIS